MKVGWKVKLCGVAGGQDGDFDACRFVVCLVKKEKGRKGLARLNFSTVAKSWSGLLLSGGKFADSQQILLRVSILPLHFDSYTILQDRSSVYM